MKDTIALRIVHETNPGKYFPALFLLAERPETGLRLTGAHRYSVVKEWLRAGLKDRTPLGARTRNAWGDLRLRLQLSRLRDETVLLAFAPWDPRMLWFRGLTARNRVIYHTSWHDWGLDNTPRQPKPAAFKRWLRGVWVRFLGQSEVVIVAVTQGVADAVQAATGRAAHVIPHAVPEVFFNAGRARSPAQSPASPGDPLRLLYVGEISEKKGIPQLREMMGLLKDQPVTLTLVGDGVLAKDLQRDLPPNTRFLGPVFDRARLADIAARQDVLLVPSQRTETWEELFGIVIVEALAAGCAVLASDHVGPADILAPVQGLGLLPEADIAAWTEQISALASEPGQLKALQSQQAPAAEAYHIDSVAARWQEVLAA